MGTRPPHTTLTGKARHSNKNQSPPHKGRSLPCAASTTTTPTRRHLDAAQPTHHKLELELDRSQRGLRPISRRSTTGPMAERGGFEPPVRQAHSGFQDRHIRPLCHLSMPAQPLEPLDAHAGDPTLPPPPRCATPWPTRAIRFSRLNRLSRINGIDRADRRQPREKNPRLRVGLADAGTGEAGLSRRPSAKACAIAGHTGRRGMSVACRAW